MVSQLGYYDPIWVNVLSYVFFLHLFIVLGLLAYRNGRVLLVSDFRHLSIKKVGNWLEAAMLNQ
jgi:hypothetical protein